MIHRNIKDTASFWYSELPEWNPHKQALVYIDVTIGKFVGSSGGQDNAENMTPYECIVATMKTYSNRGDDRVHEIHWGVIDIDRIKNSHKLDPTYKKQRQFDRLIRTQIMEHDKGLRPSKTNDEIIERNKKKLSLDECLAILHDVYGSNRDKPSIIPLDSNQIQIKQDRTLVRTQHKNRQILINSETAHTRIGKNNINYHCVNPNCRIFIYPTGFFATHQIADTMTKQDMWIEWRGRSVEEIMKDIGVAIDKNKNIHLAVSGFESENGERLQVLKLFKGLDVTIVVDEPDYHQWKQPKLYKRILKYVV
jgi:hypothetical protein